MKKGLMLIAAILTGLSLPVMAEEYPSKAIKLIVGFAPGGPNDILGRLVAKALSDQVGQPVEVENIPGSSGNLARAMVGTG